MNQQQKYYRGDVWIARIGESPIARKGINRPIVILQNDVGNYYSPTVIGAELSNHIRNITMPTHVVVNSGPCAGAMAKAEEIHTLEKTDLLRYVGHLDDHVMKKVDEAVRISLGLSENEDRRLECICSRCRKSGFNDAVNLRRADPYQVEMDLCSYCGQNKGYDYWVTEKKKNNSSVRKTSS